MKIKLNDMVDCVSQYSSAVAGEIGSSDAITRKDREVLRDFAHKHTGQNLDVACEEAYRARDYDKAFRYAELGDLFGFKYCQRMLGYMYKDGEGVEADSEKSLEYFKKAAGNGDVKAAFQLGYMYSKGEMVERDNTESSKWYIKAALSGDRTAQYNLGRHYEDGCDVRNDITKAIVWYRKAAKRGLESAKKRLHAMGVDL